MEDTKHEEILDEEYIPRPRWQVWGARVALVVAVAAALLYYWSIANPF